ncbi:unnamed protein product [Clonostachys rhizophaga]|uniref:Heterokaryon incompatibility domain-containing protein n=1 Tax=Clonostachys rhizophaga TaxID=160324 RepID=A0A9N9YK72_9HYPO|nr:unnamed protein product [Clonostachys rhizophaga]
MTDHMTHFVMLAQMLRFRTAQQRWRRLSESEDWDSADPEDDNTMPFCTPICLYFGQPRAPPDFSYSFVDELMEIEEFKDYFPESTVEYLERLGMWDESERRVRHEWLVERKRAQELESYPTRLPHAGRYKWIGPESDQPPSWVWDSMRHQTVEVTDEILKEGYIAVSYTWGRWRGEGSRPVKGVPWEIPRIKPSSYSDVIKLLQLLSAIPGSRYYWIDVLCINQEDSNQREREIAKQGSIFGKAKAVFVYAWTIPDGHQLALALCNLGESLLWALRVPPRGIFGGQTATYAGRPIRRASIWNTLRDSEAAQTLRDDHWFSSLWTLQEMILCPSGLLMTRNGEFCTINGRIATVASLAAAIYIMDVMNDAELLRRLDTELVIQKFRTWIDWSSRILLNVSLTADRTDILIAATKRTATKRRGEAVLAALKVASDDGPFDENGLTASGLPPSLLRRIFLAEGSRLFMYATDAVPGRFFSDMVGGSGNQRPRDILEGSVEFVSTATWSIGDDMGVGIPHPAKVLVTAEKVVLHLCVGICSPPMTMGEAIRFTYAAHRKWTQRKRLSQQIQQVWRSMAACCHSVRSSDSGNFIFPPMLDLKFLHLGEDKTGSSSFGIILATTIPPLTSGELWYKCGTYRAQGRPEFQMTAEYMYIISPSFK